MEQQFTVSEIVNDGNIKNTEKVRLLYLKHDKTYAEIADLLHLKESTVRFTVSNGGYCKRPRIRHVGLAAKIKGLYDANPGITGPQIAKELGCAVTMVYKYAKEFGIVFDRRGKRGGTPIETNNQRPAPIPEESTSPPEVVVPKVESVEPKPTSGYVDDADTADDEKPYEILDWPMVIYRGRMYEVMSKNQLRRQLRVDLNIIPSKSKRKRRRKNIEA